MTGNSGNWRLRGDGSRARWAALLGPALLLSACGQGAERDLGEPASSVEAALSSGIHAEIAHQFDGVDDRVTVPDHSAYALGAGDFTFEVTARVANDGRYLVPLLSKRTGPYDGFYFVLYGDRLLLQLNGVPNYLSNSVANLKDGNFHQFAVVRAAGVVTFYVDGVEAGRVSSLRSVNSGGPLYIGYDAYDQTGLAGNVRSARLWSTPRTAQQLQAALGSPPPSTSPGLLGQWGVSLGGGELILDTSPTQNPGYLGTDRLACDGANPQIFAPESNVLRVSTTGHNARIAGSDQCADILVDGTMEYFNVTDSTHFVDDVKDWFCNESNLSHVTANKGTVGLDLEIEGLPIHVGANWENTSDYQSYQSFCADHSKRLDHETASHWVYNLASPLIVDAWLACMLGNQQSGDSSNLVKSSTLSSDNSTLLLKARKKLAVGQVDPVVTGFSVSGATCSGAFTLGATLGALDTAMQCVRSGNSAVFAVLTTDQGMLTWDFDQLGRLGTAYATASVSTTTLDFVRQDCTQKYLSPSCHSGGFLGLGKQRCDRTQGSLTLYSSVGEYKDASKWCSGSCGESTDDGIVRSAPGALSLNFYVPPEQRKYKKKDIPNVTYHLCANLYEQRTSTASFTSGSLDVFRSQSFIVSVPGNASSPILHLNLDSGARAVDLTKAGTVAGVTVAVGPANGVEKTYTVTVN